MAGGRQTPASPFGYKFNKIKRFSSAPSTPVTLAKVRESAVFRPFLVVFAAELGYTLKTAGDDCGLPYRFLNRGNRDI
jgi:hypothetical protein